jgi:regulator of cell morphogenesis and NO signaling
MLTEQSTLRSIALENPATIRVFERYHLDYCCGGRRPLSQACAEQGLDSAAVLADLEASLHGLATAEHDFAQATLAQLIRHIVQTHHAFVRSELPRLLPLAEKVARKHGPAHPQYLQIELQLRQLGAELMDHLAKEESILFPYVEALEKSRSGGAIPHACFASVQNPIQMMLHEHQAAGALLLAMRTSTGGFTPPADACPTLTGLLAGLSEFERDLHRHVHLENNLLFPRAVSLEKKSLAAV